MKSRSQFRLALASTVFGLSLVLSLILVTATPADAAAQAAARCYTCITTSACGNASLTGATKCNVNCDDDGCTCILSGQDCLVMPEPPGEPVPKEV